ncbi:MAG: hypothetical protein AAFU83_04395, partial [Bacteroidota bacterium]
AICNECFTGMKGEEEFKRLQKCVEISLNQLSTLLILDGLDEQVGVSEKILKEAKGGKHKLLFTSRPYGVDTERSLVDIEIDHMGLDEEQRDRFVRNVLIRSGEATATHLLDFIKSHQLVEMTQVPVNLKILCTLWREKRKDMEKYNAPMSLSALYRELVNHVWERFHKKTKKKGGQSYKKSDKLTLFRDLENIALASLEEGSLIIELSSVKKILNLDSEPSELLETAGFLLFQNIDPVDREAIDPRYQFPHLTFQEYFAGRRLARQFLSKDEDDREEVADFLRRHMYIPRYRRTLSFMAGEVVKGMAQEMGMKTKKKGLERMRRLLALVSVPKEILGVQYLLLQLRLLNEWLLVTEDVDEGSDTVAALEHELHLASSLSMWFNESLRDRVLQNTLQNLLSEASGVIKHYGTGLQKHTLNALQDSDSFVRSAALQSLPPLLEQGAEVQAMLTPILNALQDSSWNVRIAALQALRTLVEKGAEVQAMLTPILNALQD